MKTKKKERTLAMTPAEEKLAEKIMLFVVEQIKEYRPAFNCKSCDSFDGGYCGHFGDNVPDHVIEKGCDAWSEQIPF